MNDELRRLTVEVERLKEDLERFLRIDVQQPEVLLVKTATKDTYPVVAASYYYCEIQKIAAGTPAEGEAPTISGTGRYVWVYNIGTSIPDVGTLRLASLRGGRYFMNYC